MVAAGQGAPALGGSWAEPVGPARLAQPRVRTAARVEREEKGRQAVPEEWAVTPPAMGKEGRVVKVVKVLGA